MIKSNEKVVFLLVTTSCLLAGCATPKLSGVDEYKQLTKKASVAVQNALQSLEQVSAGPGRTASRKVVAFARDVQHLQVDSVQIRARARAIRARGDAYFADWSESIAKISDPKIRAAATRSRPQLEASFNQIKLSSQQAGAAFDPFLSGLQKLRVQLELKPDGPVSATDQELAHNTLTQGRQVLTELSRIDTALQNITKHLTSREVSTQQQP